MKKGVIMFVVDSENHIILSTITNKPIPGNYQHIFFVVKIENKIEPFSDTNPY